MQRRRFAVKELRFQFRKRARKHFLIPEITMKLYILRAVYRAFYNFKSEAGHSVQRGDVYKTDFFNIFQRFVSLDLQAIN